MYHFLIFAFLCFLYSLVRWRLSVAVEPKRLRLSENLAKICDLEETPDWLHKRMAAIEANAFRGSVLWALNILFIPYLFFKGASKPERGPLSDQVRQLEDKIFHDYLLSVAARAPIGALLLLLQALLFVAVMLLVGRSHMVLSQVKTVISSASLRYIKKSSNSPTL